MSRRRVVVLLLTAGSWCCEPLFPQDATAALEAAARQFLPNAGQWQPEVLFAARGDTALAAVTATGVELRLARPADQPMLPLVLRWSRPCGEVVGEQAAGGAFAVFQGRDRSRWRSGLTGFGMVRCRAIAAGVDLRLRQAAAGFEYDLLLAPGADLTQVKLQVDGGLGMALEADGRLRIDTAAGPLYQGIPATWAELPDGSRQPVNCRFAVCAADRFGFELEDRPAGRPIVIDPVLAWSTYFGGSGSDTVNAVTTVPGSGDLVVVGPTSAPGWPGLPSGGAQTGYGGGAIDAFVARLAAGSGALLAFTYLGGSLSDNAFDVATDAAGAVYVTGSTSSADFPTLTPVQAGHNGMTDAFLTKLDPMLSAIVFSTCLGGSSADSGRAVAVTVAGEAVVVGTTSSPDFPLAAPAQTIQRGSDAFVARFTAAGTALLHATLLGGSNGEQGVDVRIGGDDAFVCGWTTSPDLPIYRAFDTTLSGGMDGFVASYARSGVRMWTSYVGGSGGDSALGVALHPSGAVFVAGSTTSTDLPSAGMPLQPALAGSSDLYVLRIAGAGGSVSATTWFGGSGTENCTNLEVAPGGMVLLSGTTDSIDLPVTAGTFQARPAGLEDRFVAVLDASLSALVFGSHFGGADYDSGGGLAAVAGIGAFGFALAGATLSADLPVTSGAYATALSGTGDGFLAMMTPHDFGDLPDSYLTLESSMGPHYADVGLQRLGSVADLERDGQPSGAADGDDTPGRDDEDGVAFSSSGVAVTVTSWRTGSVPYRIDAWFDTDGSGTFDEATEHLISSTGTSAGAVSITRGSATTTPTVVTFVFPVLPLGRAPGEFPSRFRLSWDVPAATPILHFGEYVAASDGNSHGEVEDYAPGLLPPPCHRLTTTLTATSSTQAGATLLFDLDASVPVTVLGLELNLTGSSPGTVEVYTCAGSRLGQQNNAAAWTLVGASTVTPAGINVPTNVPLPPLAISPGVTGIAVRAVGIAQRYGPGNASFTTPELTLHTGEAVSGLFTGGVATGRTVNCRICYAAAGTPWAVREPFGAGCPAGGSSTFREWFAGGTFDLAATTPGSVNSIRLTRQGRGYRLAPGSNGWHVPVSASLGRGDDWVSPPQPLPFAFPYPLGITSELRVGSNGVVWPTGRYDIDYSATVTELLAGPPRYCLLWTDLDTTNYGALTAEALGPLAFAVTWSQVQIYNANAFIDAQIVFFAAGDVEMRWRSCTVPNAALVGWSLGDGSADTGPLDLSQLPATGLATGEDGAPLLLDAITRPIVGTSCLLAVDHIPAGAAFAAVLFGLQIHDPGIDLSPLAMPGCRQYTTGLATQMLTLPGPQATTVLPVPAGPSLIGLPLGAQAVTHAPQYNPAGVITSNGLRLIVGN